MRGTSQSYSFFNNNSSCVDNLKQWLPLPLCSSATSAEALKHSGHVEVKHYRWDRGETSVTLSMFVPIRQTLENVTKNKAPFKTQLLLPFCARIRSSLPLNVEPLLGYQVSTGESYRSLSLCCLASERAWEGALHTELVDFMCPNSQIRH